MKKQQKMFVIRKYIVANNAKEAIKKDKTTPVDDVYIDPDFQRDNLSSVLGFRK